MATITKKEIFKLQLIQARLENRQKVLESALSSDILQMVALTNKNLQTIEGVNDDIKEANELFKTIIRELLLKSIK